MITSNKVQVALDRLKNSIPDDCIVHDLPDASVLDVRDFPESSGLLSPAEIQLTHLTPSEILAQISSGALTSEAVTRAFIRRASIATQLVNCCTEIMADTAIARARQLDEEFARTGTRRGPLHGLPISLKEHILIAGRNCHTSYVAWTEGVEPSNGLIYDVVLETGAVPFCRTTQPQAVMHLETSSNIYGHTVNPYNRTRTPGGSSGGESALLAMRGSPFGVGSDIGGSIRGPAALCGLYGLKATSLRVPGGTKGLHKGRESILSSMGPLCHTREDINLWMKAMLSMSPWRREPSLLPMPWRDVEMKKDELVVAVMWSDGVVKPLPPVTRALKQVCGAMKNDGIRIVEWTPKDHADSWDIISSLYWTNGAEDEYAMFEEGGEEPVPLTKWILSHPGVKYNTYNENNDLLIRRNKFKTDYAQHWLAEEQKKGGRIDCILCPSGPGPAPKLGTSKYWTYTSVWNLLDYPGVAFPVTTVAETDTEDYQPCNEKEEEVWQDWSAQESKGLPVSLQLVGRRYEDERVMAALAVIERSMGRD